MGENSPKGGLFSARGEGEQAVQGLESSCTKAGTLERGGHFPELCTPGHFQSGLHWLQVPLGFCQSQLPSQLLLSPVTELEKACFLPTHRGLN